jgi:hypothetical protein
VVLLWLGISTRYCVYWRKTTTINPIIIRPHIVFNDGRQQRKPNHNTTTYCFYWRTTTINPIIIRPHIVFTVSKHNMWSYYDWVYCCLPSVNTICGRIMIGFIVVVFRQKTQYVVVLFLGLLLLSVSKNNMWSYYDWVFVDKPKHNQTTYCVYWRVTTTIYPIIIRPHIVFTDGQQQRKPIHNTTTYCVYWWTTTVRQ